MYCSYQQDNWKGLLPLAEFAFNNAPSATMGISPFFANKGYHPNITVHPELEVNSAKAKEFAVNLDDLHQELWTQISEAQKCYQRPADSRRSAAPDFKSVISLSSRPHSFALLGPLRSCQKRIWDRLK